MTYKFKDYAGEPKHCCLIMDLLIDEGYLGERLSLNFEKGELASFIALPGPKLSERSRKHKPSMRIDYCPGCGKKLIDDEPAPTEQENEAEATS